MKDKNKKENKLDFIKKNFGKRKEQLLRKNSEAERHFMKLLDQTPYYYIREKCCYDRNRNWCYIDFYIPCYRLGIEIDGKEHNTRKHKAKDKRKDNFLSEERGIDIYRITNEDCLKMRSVDVLGIVKQIRAKYPLTYEMSVKAKNQLLAQQEEELKQAQQRVKFDVKQRVYAYCKFNDKIYEYKNVYFLRKATMMKYKNILRAMSDMDNIFASSTFIYDFNKDALQEKINKYYDYFWESRSDDEIYCDCYVFV